MRERPYARQYSSSYHWPTSFLGWLGWLLLRMPGSILIWWDYYFPRRGDVWASARRPGNRVVEVLMTLAIYAFVGFIILNWIVHR